MLYYRSYGAPTRDRMGRMGRIPFAGPIAAVISEVVVLVRRLRLRIPLKMVDGFMSGREVTLPAGDTAT
uniref:Uncharacterized protein n=1 Tax=Parascaris univalens TaxID=6257 RepID=A0A915C5Q5_PARUN